VDSPPEDDMNCNITLCHSCGARYPWQAGLTFAVLCFGLCAASFSAGYHTCSRHYQEQVIEEGKRRFAEFLRIGIDMGFVTVDRQKLDELECITSEAEWEDNDAAQRANGGTK
jgi:hypothetical protein